MRSKEPQSKKKTSGEHDDFSDADEDELADQMADSLLQEAENTGVFVN